MSWEVLFFQNDDGSVPVRDFIDNLPRNLAAKVHAIVELLAERGQNLPFPHCSRVRGKLFELRTRHRRDRIRILYFADARRRFILLHVFIKRSRRLSAADLRIGEERMREHDYRIHGRRER